jgi:hypothetical protein
MKSPNYIAGGGSLKTRRLAEKNESRKGHKGLYYSLDIERGGSINFKEFTITIFKHRRFFLYL